MKQSFLLERPCIFSLLQVAQRNLEQAGRLDAVLFVHYASGKLAQVALVLSGTYEQKRQRLTRLGEQLRETGGVFTAAVMLMECWIVNAQEAPSARHIRPSRHPSRQEAIVLLGRNADNTRQTWVVQPFTRDAHDKPVWEARPIAQCNEPVSGGNRAEGLLDFLFSR